MAFLREHVHLCKVWTDHRHQVIHAWLQGGYGLYHVHLGQRTDTALTVPVLLQQPVACTGSGMLVPILAPVLGRLMLPALLAVSLVGLVIRLRGQFGTLPLGFSSPLAGLVGTETLRLHPGIRQHETPAMGTANGAVHGFLLREAGPRKKRLSQEE
jgi:hypothetical protein